MQKAIFIIIGFFDRFCFHFQGLDGLPGDKGDDGEAGQPVSFPQDLPLVSNVIIVSNILALYAVYSCLISLSLLS